MSKKGANEGSDWARVFETTPPAPDPHNEMPEEEATMWANYEALQGYFAEEPTVVMVVQLITPIGG